MTTIAADQPTPNAERRTPNVPSRIRLRMSTHCRMLGLMLLLMVVAAINYQSNAAWGLVMALGCAVALSALHARRNLAGVTLAAGAPAPVFAGEPRRLSLTLGAASADAFDLTVAFPEEPGAARQPGVAIPAGGVATIAAELPPAERGAWALTRARVSTHYPFGLIEAWREVPLEVSGLVYPQPLGEGAAASAGDSDPAGEGGSQPGAEDFLGHRSYRDGDPQRHIDWKARARGGPLLVKQFAGAGGGVAWCEWERARGGAERRLSQLARWVVDAHRAGLRFGLRLPGSAVEPDRGPAHYHACLRLLALQARAPDEQPRAPDEREDA